MKILRFVISLLLVFGASKIFATSGDLDNNGITNIKDVIIGLQVVAGKDVSANSSGDVNGDGTIGVPEVIYAIKETKTPDGRQLSSCDTLSEWSSGQINDQFYMEGSGSLEWDHADNSSVSLTTTYPLNLANGDYISIWVHNNLPVRDDGFIILFKAEGGGSYYMRIRLDHLGWRKVIMPKEVFTATDDPSGWEAITSIKAYASGWSNTINTNRVTLLDDLRLLDHSDPLLSARFLASFEYSSLAADVGYEMIQTTLSTFTVVDNPKISTQNSSKKVLLANANQGYIRAEYHSTKMETEGKTYIYAWKEYFPTDFLDGKEMNWLALGQWKTWPCEKIGDSDPQYAKYGELICDSGGIFNDRGMDHDDHNKVRYRFRAEPDCNKFVEPMVKNVWNAYALEIYWTNTKEGYYRLYKNGVLIEEQSNVKTLFDDFLPGTCDMRWGMGLYTDWTSTGAESLSLYLDDIAIFDVEDGVTIEQVLTWQ